MSVCVCVFVSVWERRGSFQRHKSPVRLRCLMFYCAKPGLYKISRLTLQAGGLKKIIFSAFRELISQLEAK